MILKPVLVSLAQLLTQLAHDPSCHPLHWMPLSSLGAGSFRVRQLLTNFISFICPLVFQPVSVWLPRCQWQRNPFLQSKCGGLLIYKCECACGTCPQPIAQCPCLPPVVWWGRTAMEGENFPLWYLPCMCTYRHSSAVRLIIIKLCNEVGSQFAIWTEQTPNWEQQMWLAVT